MNPTRKTAIVAGVFYLLTEVTAMAAMLFYAPVLGHPDYILNGPRDDSGVRLGAFLEALLAIAVIGSAVTLYPIIKRQQESFALGYVAGRLVEASIIAVGAISVLAVVSMRRDFAGTTGAESAAGLSISQSLVAVHDWTFLLGPKLALGVNTVLLAHLMYRSHLVPRVIAVLGLVGGGLVFTSGTAVLLGVYADLSTIGVLAAMPVLAWELSFASWLIVKGFRPSPLLTYATPGVTHDVANATV